MTSRRRAVGLRAALFCCWLAGAAATQPATGQAPAAAGPHFEKQVAPLLARHCLECHGPSKKKGRLDLSRKDAALKGGKGGAAIIPGKSSQSPLWKAVESDEMPEDRPPLSAAEKQVLRQWIDAGAVWTADVIAPPPAHPGAAPAAAADAAHWVRRLTVPEYVETVRSAVGVDVSEDARRVLPPDVRADGFSNTAYNLKTDLSHVEAYARLAALVAGRVDVAKFVAEHAPGKADLAEGRMREVIAKAGKWLLRGPLEEHEVAAFLSVSNAVAKEGGDFTEAVRYVVEAMLQSPRFVYRIEGGAGDAAGAAGRNYAVASRLSYILWGAPPDKELIRAADAGELADRSRVESQLRRMLRDGRAVTRSSQFIEEWLHLDRLRTLRPSRERFPRWDDALAADMRAETLAFFRHVAWEQNRPLSDLLNARVTFATPRLAAYYGLTGRAGGAPEAGPSPGAAARRDGLVALYTFDDGKGDTVRDASGAGEGLDLKIENPSAVKWDAGGLTVHAPTLIATAGPARRLTGALKKSKAVTVEAWLTPADASQAGPARVVTLSANPSARNVTLGQDGGKFEVRFRGKGTDANGLPGVSSAAGTARPRATHVVFTRDPAGKARLFVDGREAGTRDAGGDLSGWDDGFRLALANELTKDRPWRGTLHLVALYDRALPAEEVRRNHGAGPRPGSARPAVAPAVAAASPGGAGGKDLQALYTFGEGKGDRVRDTSGAGEPLDLRIENESAVKWDAGGLTVNAPTLIATASPPKRLIDAVRKSKALSVEAWVTPRDAGQGGPSRIVTLSADAGRRNFTLGQERDAFDVRLRTTKADANGLPSLAGPPGSARAAPAHVVYTRDAAGKARLYVDGKEKAARDAGGDLSNWDEGFRLALANELTKDRPWRGTFHRVAVYSRALTPEEIRSAGPPPATGGDGLARYDLAPQSGRGGLLTHGSVLTVGGDEASTVARGLFVLHDFLHSKVGDPPPCADTTPVPTKPGQSQRVIAEARLANAACGGCHAKFEPVAFGLEKFDGLAARHETDEHGNKLREDGEILFPGHDQPVKFQSSAELMDLLAKSERVRMNFTRKVTQFALGRPLAEADAPELEKIHTSSQAGGGTYASLITAVVLSDLVQKTATEAKQ